MPDLPDDLQEQIQTLCEEGDVAAEHENYPGALEKYWAAWELVPEPRAESDLATWILTAIGDANYLNKEFEAGRDSLSQAMKCPGAIGNPFLHLRLGQCQLELGNQDRAADELTRAYMGGGAEMFEGEEKYFDFLKTRIDAPAGGW